MEPLLRRIYLSLMLCCAPALLLAAETEALPFGHPAITQVHARWLVKDGAPPDVTSMAQTPDGWIWLASSAGLFRFDGANFTKYQPPKDVNFPGNIRTVGVLDDGTLWIAPQFGNLYFLRGEALQAFGKSSNVPLDSVRDVVRDREGRTWLGSAMGLRQLSPDGKKWREVGTEVNLANVPTLHLFVDSRGTLWVQSLTANYARWPGKEEFVKVAEQTGRGQFNEAPDGTVWSSNAGMNGLQRLSIQHDDPRHRILMHGVRTQAFTIDRRGNFWIPVQGGLKRVDMESSEPQIQGYTSQQGLSGQHANVAFEDHEGNMWVATGSGLDQFRVPRMTELPFPVYNGFSRPVLVAPNGELWTDHSHLQNLSAAPQPLWPSPTQANLSTALYRDPHGVIWIGGPGGLWHLDGLHRVREPFPSKLTAVPGLTIFSIAMDTEGALWISTGPLGAWRLKNGVWEMFGGVAGLVHLPVTAIVTGPARSLWFASVDNTIAILRDGIVRKFGPGDGIGVGTVLQIVPHDSGAWLGGDSGIAWFDGNHAVSIRGEGNESFSSASGLVLEPDGDLWANTSLGLVHIVADELARARTNPAYRVRYRRFDENDGLVGTAPALVPLPSLARMSTGELIITTNASVFRFDPLHARLNAVVPPVHIVDIQADGALIPVAGKVRLPAAPDSVRIDYTALSLAMPQRVRFQYLLDGVDTHWQAAGARRAAYYTRLPPGRYTFRVLAANDDGVWNRDGAILRFEIPPTLTQTVWFKVLCVLAAVLLVYALHKLRLRTAVRRLSRSFDARVAERERIARDLHDTLLQSVQGLILMFRRIALRTPESEPTKVLMQAALAMALDVMEEGRDKVQGLRVARHDGQELGRDLETYAARLAHMHPTAFFLVQPHPARPLHDAVYDELLVLGQEALRNAFVHALAGRIELRLDYDDKLLVMAVSDDGRGIDPAEQSGRAGHWGIPGMRERAAQLAAELSLETAPCAGTVWRLQLAARLAYAPDVAAPTAVLAVGAG